MLLDIFGRSLVKGFRKPCKTFFLFVCCLKKMSKTITGCEIFSKWGLHVFLLVAMVSAISIKRSLKTIVTIAEGCKTTDTMFYKFLPVLFNIVVAKPLYVETPPSLESGANFASGLINQPLSLLYQYGNLEALGKSLLRSQIPKGLPLPIINPAATLAFTSPEILGTLAPLLYATKKEMMLPEKKVAGALIKEVPKVSKLPISVALEPKLELASLTQAGTLGEDFSGGGIIPGKSFLNSLGLSYGF